MNTIEEELKKASSYRESGKLDRAEDLLYSLLKQVTDDWRLWNEFGHVLVGKGEFSDAHVAYERAIELEPDRTGLWNNKGFALKEMGNLEEAIDATYRAKSLAVDSRDIKTANYNLACYLCLSGKTEQALDHLRIACADDESIRNWAKQDKDFDPIRSDPRFKDIVG